MRRLLIFAAAFAAAAAISVLTIPTALPVQAAAVLAAGISLHPPLRREPRLRPLRICLLGVSVGLAWCAGYRALALGSAARYDGAEMQIDALVLETPEAGKYGAAAPVELRLDGRHPLSARAGAGAAARRPGKLPHEAQACAGERFAG